MVSSNQECLTSSSEEYLQSLSQSNAVSSYINCNESINNLRERFVQCDYGIMSLLSEFNEAHVVVKGGTLVASTVSLRSSLFSTVLLLIKPDASATSVRTHVLYGAARDSSGRYALQSNIVDLNLKRDDVTAELAVVSSKKAACQQGYYELTVSFSAFVNGVTEDMFTCTGCTVTHVERRSDVL